MAGDLVRYVLMFCVRMVWLVRRSQTSSMARSPSHMSPSRMSRSRAKNTESIGLPVLTALLMTLAAALVLIELEVRFWDIAGLPTDYLMGSLFRPFIPK